MNNKIDFVILWVDGNDPEWQKEKIKYDIKKNTDGSIYRYRDWDLLQYWFRGVEKFAPWVNKIYFITWGHLPEWLDTSNEKLVIVNHKDYIPEEYLPTFNSNVIELNINKIKGLSDNFVLFNDDLFLIKKVKETDFFINNIPVDSAALNVHCPKKDLISQNFCLNDIEIINYYFDFKKSVKENHKKWLNYKNGKELLRTLTLLKCPRFPGIYQHHLSISYNKKTFEEVWNKEKETLKETCTHKFREKTDVSHWLFREWQLASGNFENRKLNFGKSFFIDRDVIQIKKDIINYIVKQKGKMIAINDGPMSDDEFDKLLIDLKLAFETILPEKSSFEKYER